MRPRSFKRWVRFNLHAENVLTQICLISGITSHHGRCTYLYMCSHWLSVSRSESCSCGISISSRRGMSSHVRCTIDIHHRWHASSETTVENYDNGRYVRIARARGTVRHSRPSYLRPPSTYIYFRTRSSLTPSTWVDKRTSPSSSISDLLASESGSRFMPCVLNPDLHPNSL